MSAHHCPPPDVELMAALSAAQPSGTTPLTEETLANRRAMTASRAPTMEALQRGGNVLVAQHSILADDGSELSALMLRPAELEDRAAPAIYYLHGGGLVMGNARTGVETALEWALRIGAVVISMEYRLAPEFCDEIPVEDCYRGLCWVHDNARVLGIDPTRVIVAGASAGGGLAAGSTLLARDRGGPAVLGQLLMAPMLDDRANMSSSRDSAQQNVWDLQSNDTGWRALLGDRRGSDDVSVYSAPARATDVVGLPSTYVDVGSVELFRDESVDFALRLLCAGTPAELHVWSGGFHAFDVIAPQAQISSICADTRTNWLRRLLAS